MIRVIVEMLPGGVDCGDENETLGVMLIHNDLLQTLRTEGKKGTYSYSLRKKRNRVSASGRVSNFPRLSYHVWNLVRRALNDAAEQNGGVI